MAETKPTATASVKATSVQAKKSSNAISWLAPVICLIAGYLIWRFIFGNADGFNQPDKAGGFWPKHDKPKEVHMSRHLHGRNYHSDSYRYVPDGSLHFQLKDCLRSVKP